MSYGSLDQGKVVYNKNQVTNSRDEKVINLLSPSWHRHCGLLRCIMPSKGISLGSLETFVNPSLCASVLRFIGPGKISKYIPVYRLNLVDSWGQKSPGSPSRPLCSPLPASPPPSHQPPLDQIWKWQMKRNEWMNLIENSKLQSIPSRKIILSNAFTTFNF